MKRKRDPDVGKPRTMRLRKPMRARLGQRPLLTAMPALLLVVAMTAGPLACPGRRFVEERPNASAEELLRWSELSKSGRDHLRFGRLEEADQELEAAFELSRSFRASDARRVSAIGNLRQLAMAYWNAGRSPDFVRLMEDLMPECREVPDSQTELMADALVRFGSLQRQEGELTASREALELALSIRRQKIGEGDLSVAQVRGELGLTWVELGDLSRAEEEIDAATDIAAQAAGRETPAFASMLIAKTRLLEAQEKMGDAEAELLRAVEIDKKAVGPSHSATLKAIAELAAFYQRHERAAEAEAALKEIVAAERDKNDASPRYVRSLNELAQFYLETGQPDKAESQARTALEIFEKQEIGGLPKAILLDTLATSLQRQGRHTESEKVYLEALEESQEETGAGAERFEEIAGHYGELLRQLGRDEEAETLLDRLRKVPAESGASETAPGSHAEAEGTK